MYVARLLSDMENCHIVVLAATAQPGMPMQVLDQAKMLHQMGRVAEADAAYRAVLARDPRQFDALHLLGVLRYQQGRPQEARDLLSQAVKIEPRSLQVLSVLMAVHLALGRPEEALTACDRIVAIEPRDLNALYNRAILLSRLGRFEVALPAFDSVLARDGGNVDALFERGNVLAALSRFDAAADAYGLVLKKVPAHLGALTNRGNALAKRGRYVEALASYDQALAANGNDVNTLNNRAVALKELGRYDEAMTTSERILRLDANAIPALITRGNILMRLARYEEALASFERVLASQPRDVDALNNRGLAFTHLRRFGEALASFDRALAVDPSHAGALDNRGAAFFVAGRFAEALADFDRALALKPGDADTLDHRGHALANLGHYEDAVATWRKALAIDPCHASALSGLAFYRLMICDWSDLAAFTSELRRMLDEGRAEAEPFTMLAYALSPAEQLRHTQRFVHRRMPSVTRLPAIAKVRSQRRIKVAYLSSSFNRHPTGWQIAELFELHDREQFEVLGISYGPDDGSDIRARLVKAFDQFHDVVLRNDQEVARLLRDLDVDIAVDLKGHTEQARPAILAYRPAPIQVSYFGFTATMGVDFIDYILADRVVLPFEQQQHYSEQVVHLPDSYWVNDSKREVATEVPSRRAVGLPEDGFVFCCFNNSYKITPEVFDVWMRVLQQVEGSVLWLLQTSEAGLRNLRNEARARGIDPSRLVFAPKAELSQHVARHRLADLFLDNLPVNAHTAASDALWVGLPVLTCAGDSFIGRVAASLLTAAGLPELVTRNLEEYEALALKLARDPDLLAALRQRLADTRATFPLFDTARRCRHIERAYTTMSEMSRRGEPPRSFAVESS
jgi:predicted O-linked N-acetylglucosamine transferase (SPINDLY family)